MRALTFFIALALSVNAFAATELTHQEKTQTTQEILEQIGVLTIESNKIKERIKARTDRTKLVLDKKSLTTDFEQTGVAQVVTRPDGTVVFPYGQMPALLTCAPLRVCTVQLGDDEKVLNAAAGDTARWQINPAKSGKRDIAIVKPLQDGLSTNLVITTDKRVYNVELQSRKNDSVPSIAFWYPEDSLVQKWAKDEAMAAELKRDNEMTTTTMSADKLNFGYEMDGDARKYLMPVRVFDDGQQVIIQMSEEMKRMEAPVLFVLDAAGNKKLVNYRVKNGNFIVDKLFDRAMLVLGHDNSQETITIKRKGYESPESLSADYSKMDVSFVQKNDNWWMN